VGRPGGAPYSATRPLPFRLVSSRKEQKERLRQEREAREREAREAERRRRLVGYGIGGVLALAALVVLAVVLLGGGGGDSASGEKANAEVLPGGGKVPPADITDLRTAAKKAGCELKSFKATSREHVTNIHQKIRYSSNPPTSGSHYQVPADDGAYAKSPPVDQLVHNLEHGRIVIWFKPSLPKSARADLKAFFDEDSYQMVLTPKPDMPYQVAASAWGRDPLPNGKGFLLGCRKFTPKLFDALRDFRDAHRGKGPEPVP
jgi:hypothetical protein